VGWMDAGTRDPCCGYPRLAASNRANEPGNRETKNARNPYPARLW